MFGLLRPTGSVVIMLIAAVVIGITVGVAQSPPTKPEPRQPPEPEPRQPPELENWVPPPLESLQRPAARHPEPRKLDSIRRAMAGEQVVDECDDGVFGGILDVIQGRPSVLDRFPSDVELLDEPQPRGGWRPKQSRQGPHRRATAAEWLLRTSRMLESIESDDASRRELIGKMRAEAGRLLAE
jgi:hypothetical protein